MTHIVRIILLVIVLVATAAVVVGAGPSGDSPGPGARPSSSSQGESRIRAVGVDRAPRAEQPLPEAEQALVDWARDRFARAGLELPELTVRFDPSRELCHNAEGLYRHEPDGERVVTICAPDHDTFAAELQARRTLLHEFGHAWDFANLSDEDREELARILGAETWDARDVDWEDRGAERLAETFVFALLDQPRRALKVSLDCSVLLRAFRTATGADPLGPGQPACAI